jgi:hypothetical protein
MEFCNIELHETFDMRSGHFPDMYICSRRKK